MESFEHVLIKNLLQNSKFLGEVSNILTEKAFSNIGCREIYKIIKSYLSEYNKAPNIPEIVASLRSIPNSELQKTIAEQIKIIVPMEPITNEDFLKKETVAFIKNSLITEALITGADGISKNNDELKMKAYSIFEEAQKIRIDSDLGLSFDEIGRRIEYYKQKLYGVPSGQPALDERLGGGFLKKTLSIVAAPPGVGKSLLMSDIASNVLRAGKNVLFIALEMSEFESLKRIDANVLDLPINGLKELDDQVIQMAYDRVKDSVGQVFIKEYGSGSFSVIQLKALLDAYRIEKGIAFDLIIVDYLGLMKSDRVSAAIGSYGYIKSISEELRGLAITEDIPIVSPAQLNRSAMGNLEADNESISESAGILQTADVVLFILQTREMKEQKIYTFKLTKNRFTGDTTSWTMGIDYLKMKFISTVIPQAQSITQAVDHALTYNEGTGTLNDSSALAGFDFGDI